MRSEEADELVECAHSGELNPERAADCSTCRQSRAGSGAAAARGTFRLSSLMLLIALIAVCLAILRVAPGLGIFAALIVTPALMRTYTATVRRRGKGQPMTRMDQFALFASMLGLMIGVWLAAGIGFAFVCTTVGLLANTGMDDPFGVAVSLGSGGVAAAWIAYVVLRDAKPPRG